jgi:hypothetical protein
MHEEQIQMVNMNLQNFHHLEKKDKLIGLCGVLLGAGIIAFLSINRHYFTYGTETDYLGGFIKEAQRILDGKPLLLKFHPPLYSAVLAFVQSLFHDWFLTGLLLSWISGAIVLGMSFIFFFQLGGRYAAWGSLAGLVSSHAFLSYSAQATSDLFYLALYCSSFFFALQALLRKNNLFWVITGFVAGSALLTRSNSLTLLALFAFPWIRSVSFKIRFKNFLWLLIAFIVPLLIWVIIAKSTGSQVTPSGNHINLALTYFSQDTDRISGDARKLVEGRFHNIFDVLTYDPLHIAITYVKDFYGMLKNNLAQNLLLAFPLNLFALPGLFFLVFRTNRPFIVLFMIATLLQIFLNNFKAYEMRYYLFLIPVLGAGVGLCIKKISESIPHFIIVIILLPFIIFGLTESFLKTYSSLHSEDRELSEAVPVVKKWLNSDTVVIARKSHIAFYTKSQLFGFPQVDTLKDLHMAIEKKWKGNPVYLYFGSAEFRRRSQFDVLGNPEDKPEWLEVVAKSNKPGNWILYRYKPAI